MPMSEQIRAYTGSPAGKKVVPVASIGLVLVGAILVLVSLTGSGSDESPTTVAAPAAPGELTEAMAVAKTALGAEKPNSYRPFDAKAAEAAAPQFTWTDDGPAASGEISLRTSGRTKIVLVTKDGTTGTVYCIADVNGDEEVSKGTEDAQNPAECSGGWPN